MTDPAPATSSPHLLHQIGEILDAAGIHWAAIGALAVAYHGWVRASMDADALVNFKGASLDIDALQSRLKANRWEVDFRKGDPDDPLGYVIRIRDGAGHQVDLIGGIRRLDAGFFERALAAEMQGLRLRMASPEDLLALKIFAGGPLDLDDAKGILQVKADDIDRELLTTLCHRFGRAEERRLLKLLNS